MKINYFIFNRKTFALKISLLLFFLIFPSGYLSGQAVDSGSFKINTRLGFYSFEKNGEMLLHVPASSTGSTLTIQLKTGEKVLSARKNYAWKKVLRVPFEFDLASGDYSVEAEILSAGGRKYISQTNLIILNYKPNEVKTDRLTGGLIVNKIPFFPFGFYCYSPVYPTLPEEEVVKGFNMISPYQKILPETLKERKAYMDRCAQLGMKVHYNLLSVSGGGGVGSMIEGITEVQKRERLLEEIRTFRDHPALLAWYISDEPTGNRISPSTLESVYRTVQENDPWHPVSIVFMAPFLSSRRYATALDIVMADPYPVPNAPITQVGDVARQLRTEFDGKKPVWMVPQAFGGGESWGREPTVQEIRSMTYQAIINGASGIQYFIRQGLNLFPKSTATWGECGRMAVEIAELTPWLLSDEKTLPVHSASANLLASSAIHDGQLLVLVVNKVNLPQRADISISGLSGGRAKVLFENRSISINSGIISDQLSAFGSQAYLIDIKSRKEVVKPYPGNLVKDPGFEDISSPGVPAACYAWNNGDRGATYFLDSREHYEGNHSLRLVTPAENKSVRLRFFPFNLSNGKTYIVSVWAKSDPEQRAILNNSVSEEIQGNQKSGAQYFEIGLGEFGKTRFVPGKEWQQFVTFITIPGNSELPPKTNVILQMQGAGVAWFDMVQVFEAVDLQRSVNPALKFPWEELW
ncbi:MAG TPA: carbohydrate binding domain-containing protein [Bacteroidales bacterium]|nr:carbohydrate binding domain-containing protein [Bacteroidales bacterium]